MNIENIYDKIFEYCSIPGKPANKNGFVVPKRVKKIEKMATGRLDALDKNNANLDKKIKGVDNGVLKSKE